MKISYLKSVLEDVGTSSVVKVYFDRNHIVNTERYKDYPYVFWDLNSYRSLMNWHDVSKQREDVTMTAYCIGYLDKELLGGEGDMIEAYDVIRDAFREYLTVVNADAYVDIINLQAMTNELFPIGITVDAEVGVSFEVKMRLYCNIDPT